MQLKGDGSALSEKVNVFLSSDELQSVDTDTVGKIWVLTGILVNS